MRFRHALPAPADHIVAIATRRSWRATQFRILPVRENCHARPRCREQVLARPLPRVPPPPIGDRIVRDLRRMPDPCRLGIAPAAKSRCAPSRYAPARGACGDSRRRHGERHPIAIVARVVGVARGASLGRFGREPGRVGDTCGPFQSAVARRNASRARGADCQRAGCRHDRRVRPDGDIPAISQHPVFAWPASKDQFREIWPRNLDLRSAPTGRRPLRFQAGIFR